MKSRIKYHLFFTLILGYNFSFSQNTIIDSLTSILKNAKHDTTRSSILVALSESYYLSNPDSVIPLCLNAINIADKHLKNVTDKEEKKSFLASKADALNNIGFVYKNNGDIIDALDYYKKSLELKEKVGDKKGLALSLNNIGAIYENQGEIAKALEYFHKSLKLQEDINDKKGIAMSLNNIGYILKNQGDTIKALEYFGKSLKLREEINDKRGIAVTLNNIGSIYYNQGKISVALSIHQRSIKIREEIGDKKGLAMSLNNMGDIYIGKGNLDSALNYFLKALKIRKEIGHKQGITYSYNDIANIYLRLVSSTEFSGNKIKNLSLATFYSDSSLRLSKELNFPENIRNAESTFSKIDSIKGNFEDAFYHYKQFIMYRDSINNESTRKASVKNQLKYEFEKKEAILNEQQAKEIAIAEEKSRFQQIVISAIVIGLFLVLVFAGFVVRSLKLTRIQKTIIEEKQREILDSIHYAKRIQKSLLPTEKYINKTITRLNS